MAQDVCSDIIKIPVIDEISIIIQIRSRLLFKKGMTLDVFPDIPEILNIADISYILDIPTIPENAIIILIIPEIPINI